MASTSGAILLASDPLIITASPARTAVEQERRELRRVRRPGALLRRREILEQQLHHRTAGKDQIDAGRVNRFLQAACRSAEASPSSSMSPSTATRRGKSVARHGGHGGERRPHGGRIGVVALVDQQDPPSGASSTVRAPRPRGAADTRQRRQAPHGSAPSASSAASTASEFFT